MVFDRQPQNHTPPVRPAHSLNKIPSRPSDSESQVIHQLQAQNQSRQQGSTRRKVIKKPKGFTANGGPAGDDKKFKAALKKLNVQPMIGMEEVNMFKDEGSKILHFSNPKVHGAANVNTFAIHGNGQEKDLTELVPGILPQLGAESIANLRRLASSLGDLHQANSMSYKPPNMAAGANNDDDDVPALVDSFDVDEGAAPAETTAFESVD
ncbi:Nascent polypeptide-associated complex subunit beta [Puccinia graminis f. sp. tritici]|uniref:Nascent polypeptide-associated complex subunit beta n=1 Tax=Puccinia graminis f. sp. tritici TaxID=56615 RepID=A0A5B0LHI3_PUCGR|nr:Nascent polypeptide-associated complex subunit beta [Puccinia graminis f. sp. tritici]